MAEFRDISQISESGIRGRLQGLQQTGVEQQNQLRQLDLEATPTDIRQRQELTSLSIQQKQQDLNKNRQTGEMERNRAIFDMANSFIPRVIEAMEANPTQAETLFNNAQNLMAKQLKGLGFTDEEIAKTSMTFQEAGGVEGLKAVFGMAKEGADDPSDVRSFKFFQSLTDDQKRQFLQLKREGKTFKAGDVTVGVDPLTQRGEAIQIEGLDASTVTEIQDVLTDLAADKEGAKAKAKELAKKMVSDKAGEEAAGKTLDDANSIFTSLESADLDLIYGKGESVWPDLLRSQEGIDLMAQRDKLIAMLKLAERGKLKGQGQVSDSEQKILSQSVSVLSNVDISPTLATAALAEAKASMMRTAGVKSAERDGPARPTTQAEWDALPSGAIFVDPDDGKLYRKE